MNLLTLYRANLNWCLWDKIEVIVGTEEKEEMTLEQALKKYWDCKVVWFSKTEVWLNARSEE